MSAPKPKVRGPPRPVPRVPSMGRLATLKNPSNKGTPIRRPQPSTASQATTRSQDRLSAQPQGAKPKPAITYPPSTSSCPNPSCPAPNIVDDEGQKVCTGCGTVISESNIVSEVTFGESASGAAIVQGTFVGADQSHGRSFGPGFQRGGGVESREITEQNGKFLWWTLMLTLKTPHVNRC
jgi:transcription factor IIIB subunit 2